MFKKLQKPDNQGFTIIEVMIVLVIAALIMLIVFLAVPSLQRSSRNTSRKSDAGRISAAISDFISNSNGNLPGGTGGANWNGTIKDCKTIINDAGTLSQYTSANSFNCGSYNSTPSSNKFNLSSSTGAVTVNGITAQSMFLVSKATCDPNATSGTTLATKAGTTNRQVVLLYTVEPSSGQWEWNCLTVQ